MLPIYLAGLALGSLAILAGQQKLNTFAGVTIVLGDELYLTLTLEDGSLREQHRFSLGYYPICRYNVNYM